MTVTVKRLGGSVAVLIPRGVAREMELIEGTALEITAGDGEIVLRKRSRTRRPRRPIAEIVRGIKPSSYKRQSRALKEAGPVGREVW